MRVGAAGAVVTCLLLAACGSDKKSTSTTAASATTAAASTTAAGSTAPSASTPAGSTPGTGATGASTPATGSTGAGSSTTAGGAAATNPNLAIPTDETNPNGYGQDPTNPSLYKGAGGFTIDTSKCPSDWNATGGISGDTIKLFTALPLSGPIASVGIYGQGMKSYFDYVNANGGIGGKKVQFDLNDNQYKPDLTKTIVDQALADGSYFASSGINGTPHNLAIWDEMNAECIPMMVTGSGAAQWGDVIGHPWTAPGGTFAYVAESRVQAEYLKKKYPNGAKVVTITINNDFGKQYLTGLKEGLKGSNIEVVGSEMHDPAAPNLDNEFTSASATNADVLILESSGAFCTQTMANLERSSWKAVVLPAERVRLDLDLPAVDRPGPHRQGRVHRPDEHRPERPVGRRHAVHQGVQGVPADGEDGPGQHRVRRWLAVRMGDGRGAEDRCLVQRWPQPRQRGTRRAGDGSAAAVAPVGPVVQDVRHDR
jgi:ABC-type branched-subunit amino acid transport system substrate-binding protein